MFIVPAEFSEYWRQLHCTLEWFNNLLHLKIALGRRPVRFTFFQQVFRVHQSGVFFLVIAPFNLPAFCRIWVTGIAKIGRISLIAKKGIADFFASAIEFVVRAK